MKKNERGITLLSLVVTIVVLLILATVLVKISVDDNPVVEEVLDIENEYYQEKKETEQRVNDMVNGWEDIVL